MEPIAASWNHRTLFPFLVVALSIIAGVAILLAPSAVTIMFGVALALALCLTARPDVSLLLLFLLLQDPLQILAGRDTTLALVVKRADEFLIVLVAALSIVIHRSVFKSIATKRLGWTIAGCYVGVVLSYLVSGEASLLSAAVDLVLFSKPFLMLAIGMSLYPRSRLVESRVSGFLLAMVIVVSSAVLFLLSPATQAAYLGDLRPPEMRLDLVCAQGLFITPAAFGWFAAASFCLCYAAYLAFNRYRYLVYSLVCATFVLLSWRRKSILAVVAVVFLSLLIRNAKTSRRRSVVTICAGALALFLTAAAPYLTELWSNTVREYGSTDPYANARSTLYYTSLIIAKDHFPLGTGLASFGSYSSRLFYSSTYDEYGLSGTYGLSPRNPSYLTDTFWPMVLGEGGIVSLLSYLGFFAILVTQAWKSSKREREAMPTFLAIGSLFLLLGSLIESTASHFYGSSLHAALALIPVGIFWRSSVVPAQEQTFDSAPQRVTTSKA